MFKKGKKEKQINIDDIKGHLFFGDDLRLIMLRPLDLIEFSEFAGTNAEDILIWVGKTLGKYFAEKLVAVVDWGLVGLSSKKYYLNQALANLEQLGYGKLSLAVKKDRLIVTINDPLSIEEKDNVMAKNLCLLYQGILNGIIEQMDLDVDGKEVNCVLLGDENCVYRFKLLEEEFDDADIDEEKEEGEAISEFLSSL